VVYPIATLKHSLRNSNCYQRKKTARSTKGTSGKFALFEDVLTGAYLTPGSPAARVHLGLLTVATFGDPVNNCWSVRIITFVTFLCCGEFKFDAEAQRTLRSAEREKVPERGRVDRQRDNFIENFCGICVICG